MRAQTSLGGRSYSTSRNSRESHMAAVGVCVECVCGGESGFARGGGGGAAVEISFHV